MAGSQAGTGRVTVDRYTVRHSTTARKHLAAIADYITSEGEPERAIAYAARIVGFCDGLALFPHRGRCRDDLIKGLYTTGFERRATITYTIDEVALIVWITGIYYGGQDWEALY
jgi:plasmid stabilization system protein ParE